MKLESLEDLYFAELRDLYDAEHQILKALPKMAEAATSTQLRHAFENHLAETEGQVRRLETLFELAGVKPKREKCEGMKGLIEEGEEFLDDDANLPVRDAALIASAQRVEHYEIAAYGCLRSYAQVLNFTEAIPLIAEILREEKAADRKLTELAEGIINEDAAQAA